MFRILGVSWVLGKIFFTCCWFKEKEGLVCVLIILQFWTLETHHTFVFFILFWKAHDFRFLAPDSARDCVWMEIWALLPLKKTFEAAQLSSVPGLGNLLPFLIVSFFLRPNFLGTCLLLAREKSVFSSHQSGLCLSDINAGQRYP